MLASKEALAAHWLQVQRWRLAMATAAHMAMDAV